jgi:small GTP-binding protein
MLQNNNIIILGDSGVGKSSIIEYLHGYINKRSVASTIREMTSTTKSVVYNKMFTIQFTHKTQSMFSSSTQTSSFNIKLLDTAGQEKYSEDKLAFLDHELTSNNVSGIIIVHDCSCVSSVENCNEYYTFIHNIIPNVIIIDIGNKSDIMSISGRPKYREHINKQKNRFSSFAWYETSARTGDNIPQVFERMIEMITNYKSVSIIRKENNTGFKRSR